MNNLQEFVETTLNVNSKSINVYTEITNDFEIKEVNDNAKIFQMCTGYTFEKPLPEVEKCINENIEKFKTIIKLLKRDGKIKDIFNAIYIPFAMTSPMLRIGCFCYYEGEDIECEFNKSLHTITDFSEIDQFIEEIK